jgi:hypothetical protein
MPRPVVLERFCPPAGCVPAEEEAAEIAADPAAAPPPHTAGPDPEAERLAVITRLAAAVEALAADQLALREEWLGKAASALGEAAASLLPPFARTGFATQVAEAAMSVARRGRWPRLVLHVAPGDAEAIAEALDRLASADVRERPVELATDPALAAGEARLGWDGGGAEIDAEAMVEAALGRLRSALADTGAKGG